MCRDVTCVRCVLLAVQGLLEVEAIRQQQETLKEKLRKYLLQAQPAPPATIRNVMQYATDKMQVSTTLQC